MFVWSGCLKREEQKLPDKAKPLKKGRFTRDTDICALNRDRLTQRFREAAKKKFFS